MWPGEGLWNKFATWLSAKPSEHDRGVGEIWSKTAYRGQSITPHTNGQLVFDGLASGLQVMAEEHRGGLGMTRAALTRRISTPNVPHEALVALLSASRMSTALSRAATAAAGSRGNRGYTVTRSGQVSTTPSNIVVSSNAAGQQPNTLYIRTNGSGTVGVQNTITNDNGQAVGQVDFKNHGGSSTSGHAHVFTPGNPSQGHHDGGMFAPIPFQNVPPTWSFLPTSLPPSQPRGQ